MTARVIGFPSPAVIVAFRVLHAPPTREAEELAASVLSVELTKGEPVPSGSLLLLLAVLRRNGDNPLGRKLAAILAEYDDEIEVLVTGQHLLLSPETRHAGLLLLRRLR